MHTKRIFLGVSALVALWGCTPARSTEPSKIAKTTSRADDSATCGDEQFVACESGEACARRQGHLVHSKTCFARAAEACDTLGCSHGCNLHAGPPKEVHCAPNASTTSDGFTRCAGFGNWVCPENMRCEVPKGSGFDAFGTCVPAQ